MKKLLLIFSVATAAFATPVIAQTPTMDFENWVHTNGPPAYDEPMGWATFNILSNPLVGGNPISCFKETANVHSGTAAMKLESVALTSNPASGQIPDTLGGAFTGSINFISQQIAFGYDYTARPQTFTWFGRYSMGPHADSAFALVVLTYWNTSTNMRDTIGVGGNILNVNYSAWTQFSSNIMYNPLFAAEQPDSMTILFNACDDIYGHPGDTLWVDDVAFSGYVGLDEAVINDRVSVYPNPSHAVTNFRTDANDAMEVIAYDMTGREVKRVSIIDQHAEINTAELANGTYTYTILNTKGEVISRGKFAVAE